jgi:hypothetical protein
MERKISSSPNGSGDIFLPAPNELSQEPTAEIDWQTVRRLMLFDKPSHHSDNRPGLDNPVSLHERITAYLGCMYRGVVKLEETDPVSMLALYAAHTGYEPSARELLQYFDESETLALPEVVEPELPQAS